MTKLEKMFYALIIVLGCLFTATYGARPDVEFPHLVPEALLFAACGGVIYIAMNAKVLLAHVHKCMFS